MLELSWFVKSLIDFSEQVILEIFQIISVDVAAHWLKSEQGRFGKYIFEVGKLLLE